MADTNIIIIIVAFVVAIGAIYILYSIILFQGGSGKKEMNSSFLQKYSGSGQGSFDKKNMLLCSCLQQNTLTEYQATLM